MRSFPFYLTAASSVFIGIAVGYLLVPQLLRPTSPPVSISPESPEPRPGNENAGEAKPDSASDDPTASPVPAPTPVVANAAAEEDPKSVGTIPPSAETKEPSADEATKETPKNLPVAEPVETPLAKTLLPLEFQPEERKRILELIAKGNRSVERDNLIRWDSAGKVVFAGTGNFLWDLPVISSEKSGTESASSSTVDTATPTADKTASDAAKTANKKEGAVNSVPPTDSAAPSGSGDSAGTATPPAVTNSGNSGIPANGDAATKTPTVSGNASDQNITDGARNEAAGKVPPTHTPRLSVFLDYFRQLGTGAGPDIPVLFKRETYEQITEGESGFKEFRAKHPNDFGKALEFLEKTENTQLDYLLKDTVSQVQDTIPHLSKEKQTRILDKIPAFLSDPEGFALVRLYLDLFGSGISGDHAGGSDAGTGLIFVLTILAKNEAPEGAFTPPNFRKAANEIHGAHSGGDAPLQRHIEAWLERNSFAPPKKAESVVERSPEKRLSPAFAKAAGQRIWESECGGTVEGLTSWNSTEGFASLGIGHFIWFPAGKEFNFEESFPAFIEFCQSFDPDQLGAKIPDWLLKTKDCPWNSYNEFQKAKNDSRMMSLRDFLVATVGIQTEFIYARLRESKGKLLEKTKKPELVGENFDKLLTTPEGFFGMLDYVNFKGEGTSEKEQYKGEGWGLLQILERMPSSVPAAEAHKAYAEAARLTLENRMKNNPPDAQYRAGWTNRVLAYAKNFGVNVDPVVTEEAAKTKSASPPEPAPRNNGAPGNSGEGNIPDQPKAGGETGSKDKGGSDSKSKAAPPAPKGNKSQDTAAATESEESEATNANRRPPVENPAPSPAE